jgi:hypothetical protein
MVIFAICGYRWSSAFERNQNTVSPWIPRVVPRTESLCIGRMAREWFMPTQPNAVVGPPGFALLTPNESFKI